jgi:hypothetical protein
MNRKSARIKPSTCALGVVTYLGRFEKYFKPLIRRLHFLFPDYEINVFINGHHNICKQLQYLKKVTSFLQKYINVRYMTHVSHQSLARGWNWLILMSTRERVLILNDDVFPEMEFRYNLERLENPPDICSINRSFSHFLIAKEVVRRVGWFDERFLGIGHEDVDYICRVASKGITLETIPIRGLQNYVAPSTDAGWAKISDVVHGKYAAVNFEIFKQKWFHSDYGPVPQQGSFKILYGSEEWTVASNKTFEPMPNFYPLACLNQQEAINYRLAPKQNFFGTRARLLSFFHYLFREGRDYLKACLKKLLGRRWDFLRKKILRSGS